MPDEAIVGIYEQLTRLLKDYRSQRLSHQHLKNSLQFSESLLELVKTQPDPLCGQLQLYKSQLPYVLNLTFNTCLLTALSCAKNKINDTCSQQLICAGLTFYSLQQTEIEKYSRGMIKEAGMELNSNLVKALDKVELDVWALGSRLTSHLSLATIVEAKPLQKLSKLQKLLLVSHYLAVQLTPRKNAKSISLGNGLKRCLQDLPYSLLEESQGFLDYPGITPPGSILRLKDHAMVVVLSVNRNTLVVKNINETTSEIKTISADIIAQVGASQIVKGFAQTTLWWDKSWKEFKDIIASTLTPNEVSFRLDRPPPALLEVQKQLNGDDIDLDKVADVIATEPTFSHYLQNTATQSSRQKIPVQQVKHGLMMHGYERANSLLVQQALILRLNQNYFPLQEQFVQFTRLRIHVAGCLIEKDSLMAERAATLAGFANSGLFTLSGLKSRRNWQRRQTNTYDVRQLSSLTDNKSLLQNPIILAKAWQQQSDNILALTQQATMPEQIKGNRTTQRLATSLGISLVLARQIYFAEANNCENTDAYVKQAMKTLSLSPGQLESISSNATVYCHLYCPVDC